jgi:hypothetical protein
MFNNENNISLLEVVIVKIIVINGGAHTYLGKTHPDDY